MIKTERKSLRARALVRRVPADAQLSAVHFGEDIRLVARMQEGISRYISRLTLLHARH